MQVFKTPWDLKPGLRLSQGLNQGLLLGLGLVLCGGLWAAGFADVVHFANGNTVHGKLDRLTGDIIEFRRSKHIFGNLDYFKRIQLTDRHDVVKTRDGQKYFGEIIYLDGFLLEIQTSSGAIRLKRMDLTDVVLGSPAQTLTVPAMHQMPPSRQVGTAPEPPDSEQSESQQSELGQPTVRMTPVSNTGPAMGNRTHTPSTESGEDEDAIPAVDSY